MAFPSLDTATARASRTARRFPLPLLAGVMAFVIVWGLVGGGEDRPQFLLVATTLLGIPLLTATRVATEWRPEGSPSSRPAVSIAVHVGALALLAWFYLASRSWSDPQAVTRFLHLALVFHLLVALVPLACRASLHAFWQYNRALFLRFLVAVLYAVVLFAGLAVAVASIDALFGVDVDAEFYLRLWFFQAFVFTTWFFLAGVPDDLEALEQRSDYPLGLKLFAQFALVPLVTVYLLILTAYFVKVLANWSWPSGWIGWLVSSVAVVGTLVLLLVHPLRDREDSAWVNVYGRWFYVALIPSVGMLLVAIGQRIGQYGLTEPRYFLLVLAVYLAGIALYYAVTASRDIRIIPTGLLVVAAVSFLGPWSAYSMSRGSQLSRLEGLLAEGGGAASSTAGASLESADSARAIEASGALRYLLSRHGPAATASLFEGVSVEGVEADARDPLDRGEVDELATALLATRGIEYSSRYRVFAGSDRTAFVRLDSDSALPVEGYEWLVNFDLGVRQTIAIGDVGADLSFDEGRQELVVELSSGERLSLPLSAFGQRLGPTDATPTVERGPGDLSFAAENEWLQLRVIFRDAYLRVRGDTWRIERGNGALLIRLR